MREGEKARRGNDIRRVVENARRREGERRERERERRGEG
jgi:hypothetical protein